MSAIAQEIAPGVFCVGLEGRTQTNAYLVRSGSSWTLIDAGWRKDEAALRQAACATLGISAPPAAILLTHIHPDHSGSALPLARAWGAPVYVHPAELPIATGDFEAIRAGSGPLDTWVILPILRLMGRRRREALLARSSLRGLVRSFEPGGPVPGLPGWQCLHTPGHTPGHASFFRPGDRVLITGDALVTLRVNSLWGIVFGRAGLSGPPWYTSWNWRAARESVAALARLQPAVLATGHGKPMTGTGTAAALSAFAERFSPLALADTAPARR